MFLTFLLRVLNCLYNIWENFMGDIENQVENINQTSDEEQIVQLNERVGVLYEYNEKHTEKLEKRKKLEGVFQFIKYALCAASAGIIQFVLGLILQAVIPDNGKTIFFISKEMTQKLFIAETVALCASILWNFTFNRKFTFKDASNVPKAMILAFLFYVPFYPFQTWYMSVVEDGLKNSVGSTGIFIIAQGTAMIMNFALEFLWQKFVVFRKPKVKEEVVEETTEEKEA